MNKSKYLKNIFLNNYRYSLNRFFPSNTKRRYHFEKFMLKFFKNYIEKIKAESVFSLILMNKNYQIMLNENIITEKELKKIKDNIELLKTKPKISIVMPVYNIEDKWLDAAINSIIDQLYENWELCIVDDASSIPSVKKTLEKFERKDKRIKVKYLLQNLGIVGASNNALDLVSGQYAGFMDNDDLLYPEALYEVIKKINECPNVKIIYTDEDKIDKFGNRIDPFFKPDWSPEFLMSCNYITHFTVMSTELVQSLEGFREGFDGSQDHELLLRATEETQEIEHIPKILYGWRQIPGSASLSNQAKPYAYVAAIKALKLKIERLGMQGSVTTVSNFLPFYRIKPKFGNPKISIIFYANEKQDIKNFLKLNIKNTYQNFELIIITDSKIILNSKSFSKYKIKKLLHVEDLSKLPKSLNLGVEFADGDFLLFLTGEIINFNKYCFESLLEIGFQKDIGVVGPLFTSQKSLIQPSIILQAGLILGLNGIASNAFMGRSWYNNPEYFGLNLTVRNCSAVSINGLFIKNKIFNQVDGFDENLKNSYFDVDLCFRVEEKGYRTVYTPYANFILKYEKNSLPLIKDEYFEKKWTKKLVKPDPYYNVNLSLNTTGGYILDEP